VTALLTVLPMAFVMVAGPQLISAVFLATSENWSKNSAAYLAGAAASITIFVTVTYFVARGVKSASSSDTLSGGHVIDIAVLLLLLFLVVYVFLKRKETEPPKWMGRLQAATPKFSFKLGFLLLGVFPTDIVTSTSVGARLAREAEPWWHCLPFIAVTLLLLALPALLLLLLGERAKTFLPKVRSWMNANSWIINEIVIGFFIAITINSLASS
jgi:Sap, sulfolipid-1-addressing protein